MRLGWYAGASTGLAGAVVLSSFHQRANFYSAMVYLSQSNFCLLVLINFSLLLYSSFVYGLTRLCYGELRTAEVEQLTERAWFAITETCLAMTIFREEIGAWFLIMFAVLVTGKVWGWIGDGRVEVLEQQPPENPRLFHTRLSFSLGLSFLFDVYVLRYTINTVIQQARPNMMVMFLFEFAVLATCSGRTVARYLLTVIEQKIEEVQKQKRLAERRREVREERETILRRRQEAADANEEIPESQDPLPSEDNIDEMDIEVPGWSAKGEWVLWLDLLTDMVKLGVYIAFFFMLLAFWGLPIHIMRDLFMTSRDFVKRLGALLRYRRAIQEMNRYPDATEEELGRENTCIICREEMRPWNQDDDPAAIDRVRPKKLPCGHILHLGCLKSWLERQQVCPTCRRPVSSESVRPAGNRGAGLQIEIGGGARPVGQQAPANGDGDAAGGNQQDGAGARPQHRGPRIFNLGPIRLGFGAGGQQARELAQQFGMEDVLNPPAAPRAPARPQNGADTTAPANAGTSATVSSTLAGDSVQNVTALLQQAEQMIQRQIQALNSTQQELVTIQMLTAELQRLRQRQQAQQDPAQNSLSSAAPGTPTLPPPMPQPSQFQMPPQLSISQPLGLPTFPTVPPRNQSPLMARHVANSNAVAIPAGSAELPDGVVIPPGWSLMPLHRVDGTQISTPVSAQTGPHTTEETADSTHHVSTTTTTQPSPSRAAGNETTESSSGPAGGESAARTLSVAPISPVEPTPVVAPSPRMPNWGGTAQLFNGDARLTQAESVPRFETQPETQPANTARTPDLTAEASGSLETPTVPQQAEDDESSEAPFKGKGRAVTVEDVDEEDEDREDKREHD